ncbi:MAG: Obg family GTPase CgtA, partial [Clostridia bacterium]|nr:Obg family GTPase CgtA [Clostridia bacterium]
VERTRLLIHVLDTSQYEGRDVLEDFKVINGELKAYSKNLAQRKQVIAANKMDLPEAEDNLERLRKTYGGQYEIFPISAVTGRGIDALLLRVGELLSEIEALPEDEVEEVQEIIITEKERKPFEIKKDDDGIYIVTGDEVTKHVLMTDLDNEEAVRRLQVIFDRMGLDDALRGMGIREGDTVHIGGMEFEFFD